MPKIDGYNPRKGLPAVIFGNLALALMRLCIKYIYNRHPEIGFAQLLFYRGFLAFAFNIVWLNRNLKMEMYDSVKRDLLCQLVLKVLHANIY